MDLIAITGIPLFHGTMVYLSRKKALRLLRMATH